MLESGSVRPRQARYQAALRPDNRNVSTRNPRGSDRLVLRVADPFEIAFEAFRLARLADPASVPDQLVREKNPSVLGNNLDQIPLDFLGILIPGQIEAIRNPPYMGVHDNSRRNPESTAQHYVGRLSRGAWNGKQLLHRPRDLAAEFLDEFLAGADDRFRLVAKETGRANFLLDFRGVGVRQILWCRIFREERLRDDVYDGIRALSGKNRRNK